MDENRNSVNLPIYARELARLDREWGLDKQPPFPFPCPKCTHLVTGMDEKGNPCACAPIPVCHRCGWDGAKA